MIGFHTLDAHAVDYADLPAKFARSRPSHGQIPVADISMIRVDIRFAGQGYGGDLMTDALKRIAKAAETVGIAVALLDVLYCGRPDFVAKRLKLYTGYSFVLPLLKPASSILAPSQRTPPHGSLTSA